MTTDPASPAFWVKGDPLHEAIAAAVYEQAETTEGSLILEDPRTIAAVAATVARQVLGTVTAPPEGEADPVGLCAACGDPREGHHHGYERTPGYDEAQQPTAAEAEEVETEAYPPLIEWTGEAQESDGLWMRIGVDPDRAVIEKRIANQTKRFPSWADGTPVRHRIVRKTTTYTVEQPAPAVTEEAK